MHTRPFVFERGFIAEIVHHDNSSFLQWISPTLRGLSPAVAEICGGVPGMVQRAGVPGEPPSEPAQSLLVALDEVPEDASSFVNALTAPENNLMVAYDDDPEKVEALRQWLRDAIVNARIYALV